MYACIQGWKDGVELLLNHSKSQQIDLNHRNNQGYTAFMSACQSGQMDVVEMLLTHPKSKIINFNARNSNGETALMRSCRHGTLDLLKNLKKRKKDAKANLVKALRISQKCPNGKKLAEKIVTVLNLDYEKSIHH